MLDLLAVLPTMHRLQKYRPCSWGNSEGDSKVSLLQDVRGRYKSLFLVLMKSQAVVHEAVEHDVSTDVTTEPPTPYLYQAMPWCTKLLSITCPRS